MPISRPQLPPKAGYVEVEVDGERKYKDVNTGEIYSPSELPPKKSIEDEINSIWDELAAAYTQGVNSI